jgi:hypothetical protein
MKWYVLKVGFLFILLAIILDFGDVAWGGFQHPQLASRVIYFWMAVLALVIALDFFLERRHLNTISSFSPLFDGGEQPEIAQGWDGTTLITSISGHYRGRLIGAKICAYYLQRSSRVSVTIALACNWPWAFEVERRTIGVRIMGAFGEVRTLGDPELDEELAISGDAPSALRRWLSRPETRQLVRRLTVEHYAELTTGTQSLSVPSLQGSYSPYHSYYRPHFPAVLEILSALAASLEQKADSVAQ